MRVFSLLFFLGGEIIGANTVLEAPVVFVAGTTITPPALKRPRRETVDSSPPPAPRITVATAASTCGGNPAGSSNDLSCIMDAPLSQSMDSVNTVACSNGEDEVSLFFKFILFIKIQFVNLFFIFLVFFRKFLILCYSLNCFLSGSSLQRVTEWLYKTLHPW